MRKFAVVLLFLSLSVFAQDRRQFTFHYAFSVRNVAPGQRLEVWFPLAKSDRFQQVRVVAIKSDLPLKRTREPRFGNAIFYATTPKATKPEYAFDVTYVVTRKERRTLGSGRNTPVITATPAVQEMYLQPDTLVPVTGRLATIGAEQVQRHTGLADMRLFCIDPKTMECTHYDLKISPSAPPTKVSYSQRIAADDDKIAKELPAPISSYRGLENRLYTWNEMLDTGLPTSEFFSVWENGKTYWVPNAFSGMASSRAKRDSVLDWDDGDDELLVESSAEALDKAMIQLEEYCLEIVGLEDKMSDLDEKMLKPDADLVKLETEYAFIQRDIQILDEKCSALGLSQSVIDDCMQECRDLSDYNNSYGISYGDDVTANDDEVVQGS